MDSFGLHPCLPVWDMATRLPSRWVCTRLSQSSVFPVSTAPLTLRLEKLAVFRLILHTPLRSCANSAREYLVTPVLTSRGTWLQKSVCSLVSSCLF
jgi:hypothetical protein